MERIEHLLFEASLHAKAIKMMIEAIPDEDAAATICQEAHYIHEKIGSAIGLLGTGQTPP